MFSYTWIENHLRVKGLGLAPGKASAQPLCNTKFADPSPPGLTTWARRREALGADEFDSHKTVEQSLVVFL